MDFVGLAARIWVPAQGRIFFQNHVLGWSGGWFLRPIMQQLGLCFAKLWKHMCGRTVFPFLALFEPVLDSNSEEFNITLQSMSFKSFEMFKLLIFFLTLQSFLLVVYLTTLKTNWVRLWGVFYLLLGFIVHPSLDVSWSLSFIHSIFSMSSSLWMISCFQLKPCVKYFLNLLKRF